MLEDLNELEKIGLAFITGVTVGQSLQEAKQEVEDEEAMETDEKDTLQKIVVGKIEGEKAEKLMKMMKELGVE